MRNLCIVNSIQEELEGRAKEEKVHFEKWVHSIIDENAKSLDQARVEGNEDLEQLREDLSA